ncbi:PREDICTED: uncharacterized protein LOC106806859 [Priapulus caudatus]|uniref:Uncharacterized protein LOC106806859 n=1 Tax=Priapulus caudatus TaxID=37621 RepID=A0ABM1DX09_PRICU|nr:PREDICTED: uncharacterized protein LOC106806859 [Priapulus caudatus]
MKLLLAKGILSTHPPLCDCEGCRVSSPVNRGRLAEKRAAQAQSEPREGDQTMMRCGEEALTVPEAGRLKHCTAPPTIGSHRLASIIDHLRTSQQKQIYQSHCSAQDHPLNLAVTAAGSKDGEKYFRKDDSDESAALRAIEEGTSRPVESRLTIKNITETVGGDDNDDDASKCASPEQPKNADSDVGEQSEIDVGENASSAQNMSDVETASVKSERDVKVEQRSPPATTPVTTDAGAERLPCKPTPIFHREYSGEPPRYHLPAEHAAPSAVARPPWVPPFAYTSLFPTGDPQRKASRPGMLGYDSYSDIALSREAEYVRRNYSEFMRNLAAKYNNSPADRYEL